YAFGSRPLRAGNGHGARVPEVVRGGVLGRLLLCVAGAAAPDLVGAVPVRRGPGSLGEVPAHHPCVAGDRRTHGARPPASRARSVEPDRGGHADPARLDAPQGIAGRSSRRRHLARGWRLATTSSGLTTRARRSVRSLWGWWRAFSTAAQWRPSRDRGRSAG